jgi:hypothetical protein
MAIMKIPTNSNDLITQLDKRYPDVLDTSETLSPFERGKVAGVVLLLRELKQAMRKELHNDSNKR